MNESGLTLRARQSDDSSQNPLVIGVMSTRRNSSNCSYRIESRLRKCIFLRAHCVARTPKISVCRWESFERIRQGGKSNKLPLACTAKGIILRCATHLVEREITHSNVCCDLADVWCYANGEISLFWENPDAPCTRGETLDSRALINNICSFFTTAWQN